jgi:hypothetical protein
MDVGVGKCIQVTHDKVQRCECGNKPLNFVKNGEFLDELSD